MVKLPAVSHVRGLRGKTIEVASAVLAAIAYLTIVLSTHFVIDDAYITFRYARNFAAGYGFVYNPGEWVLGTTTPLYGLLLSILDPLLMARVVNGVALVVLTVILLRTLGGTWAAAGIALLAVVSPEVITWSVSGMETGLYLCLIIAVLATAEQPTLCGVLSAALVMTRPDGVIAVAAVCIYHIAAKQRLPWRYGIIALATFAPWLVIATLTYGSPIPNSVAAKMIVYNNNYPVGASIALWNDPMLQVITLPFLVAGLIAVGRTHNGFMRRILLFLVLYMVAFAIGNPSLYNWYRSPAALCWTLLTGYGAARLSPRPVWLIGLVCTFVLVIPRSIIPTLQATQEGFDTVLRATGDWLNTNTPNDASITAGNIGYIGYFSNRYLLDDVGLVSPQIIPFLEVDIGNCSGIVRHFQTDYLALEPREVAQMRIVLEQDYDEIVHFESPNSTYKTYRIYRRREPQ